MSEPPRQFSETQVDWTGGRGREFSREDPTAFWDSKDAWTMTGNKLFPALEWRYGTGIRTAETAYTGSTTWKGLYGTQLYISADVVASASSTRTQVQLKLKQVGLPGTFTVAVYSNTAGSPNALVAGASATFTATAGDWASKDLVLTFGTPPSLTSTTTYHIVAYGASTDNETNHWEVGCNMSGTGSKISAAGSTWATPSPDFRMYYRLTAALTAQKLWFFLHEGAWYCVTAEDADTAPNLYINGTRGKATSGTATTLVDTGFGVQTAWANDLWNG
jgi:hypothetical protein